MCALDPPAICRRNEQAFAVNGRSPPQRSGLPAAITAKLTGLCDLWLLARVLQCGF
ncbi:hypothetical protein [Methylorubrum sp. SL192]|uniref:hypothetical protein n=1 Tax=Methylorubrum sp. SL192 TaxID=2995167 RepID=UPI00227279CF|nr:hypothetical protein [Methylorubrum sp. SL192]MCY1643432.1 hypothetical protein [Methylorubrum sp. SL192]